MAKANKIPSNWIRDQEKEKFWRRMLAEYAVSGLSIQEFCRRRNISAGSFGTWKRELQIRERERIACGDRKSVPLPTLPSKVKDSRGRVIPARFRKWLEESKCNEPKEVPSPFVALKLVEASKVESDDQPQTISQIEILCPGGFTIRLNDQADTAFVSKLLHSLEAKQC